MLCAGCGQRGAPSTGAQAIGNAREQRVAIAVVGPTRGAFQEAGRACRVAVSIALDEARAARDGDDDGSRRSAVDNVTVIEIDAGDGDLAGGRRAAKELVGRSDVIAVIAALPADGIDGLRAAREAGSDASLITTTAPAFDRADASTRSTTVDEARLAGMWIGEHLGATRPAVLSAVTAQTFDAPAFQRSVARYGRKAIAQSFPFTSSGGVDPLGELAGAGVDAVYVASSYETTGQALREAQVRGLRAVFVVPSAWDLADTRDLVRASGVRAYLLVPFAADDGSERSRRFVAAFRDQIGATPDAAAAAAYDALQVAIAAYAAANDPLDPASVGEAMHGLAGVPGLSGPLSIDALGAVSRPFIVRELYATDDVVRGTVGP